MTTPRSNSMRQKLTIGLFIVIMGIIAWQIYGLFENPNVPATNNPPAPSPGTQPTGQQPHATPAASSGTTAVVTTHPPVTQATQLPKKAGLSAEEQALIRLQQQNEERYVSALNQLQMLKIEQEIAETNRSITAAKLEAATAEQKLSGLKPSAVAAVNTDLSKSTPAPLPSMGMPNYLVVSISYLQGKWSAVLSNQGKLYQVYVGDVLSDSGAKITTIDKYGVTLQIGEESKKISLVPII